jgi:putative SOS response-associated peptidase YedK
MCSNYDEITDEDRLLREFGVSYGSRKEMAEAAAGRKQNWPTGMAAFIRLHEDGSGNKVIDRGTFGLLPGFAKEVAYGRRTYNARSETVHRLPSFRESWAKGWRCIVPVETLYEPNYESGRAERWGIRRVDGKGLAVAGIYRRWTSPDGELLWSFAMLTVNADGHPVYARMHRPGDEKRMVVILDGDEQDDWLTCPVGEASRFFRQSTLPLETFPALLPRRHRGPQREL